MGRCPTLPPRGRLASDLVTRLQVLFRLLLAVALLALSSCGVSRGDNETATTSTNATGLEEEGEDATSLPPGVRAPDGTLVEGTVASVAMANGVRFEVDEAEVTKMIDEISESDRFVSAILGGTIPESTARLLLTQVITTRVIDAEAANLGVAVSPEQISAAEGELRAELAGIFGSEADPQATADEVIIEIQSYFDLLALSEAGSRAVEAYYTEAVAEEAAALPGNACVSHILVEDEGTANELLSQLEDGGEFAALATEHSIDPGSAPRGGELGCNDPQMFVPSFRDAVLGAELDELVGPVESDFGFHILTVTGYDSSALVGQLVFGRFRALFEQTVVEINPLIGTWDAPTQSILAPA